MDVARELFEIKLRDLGDRLLIRGWDGPCYFPPDERVDQYAYRGKTTAPLWEVFMEKHERVPDSRDPTAKEAPVRAALWFSDEEAADLTVDDLAYLLALAVAGREAHEALEWTRFNKRLLIDPHRYNDQLKDAVDLIAEYLNKGAGPS
jgi:hypothetical protein